MRLCLLGYDVGSSSIKASLLDSGTGRCAASAASPDREMQISAPRPGWAEQHPDLWWRHMREATRRLLAASGAAPADVEAIGISYQMHGLVAVDEAGQVLRPAIIWCDSRAVEIGNEAFRRIGERTCLQRLLNSPGNFTASKLRWVMEREPELYRRIHRVMLPGDYLAMRMTGEACTTASGLSEGILWDYREQGPAGLVLEHYGIAPELLPPLVPTFSEQGRLTEEAAGDLGLAAGTVVSYRGGDQPNNALSLRVLEPGEMAATAGTSGVVYGVGDRPVYDGLSRFNTFVHVNHTEQAPRYGNLLCLNGAGILYSWLRHNVMSGGGANGGADGAGGAWELSYPQMNELASGVPVGSEGLCILPYGNGAERTLENRNLGCSVHGLELNRHGRGHLVRAAQEGVLFALQYGLEIMREAGIPIRTVRAGDANMFKSRIFAEGFATVSRASVELYSTDGSQGAARGAGIGAGITGVDDAFRGLERTAVIEPSAAGTDSYQAAYRRWREALSRELGGGTETGVTGA